MRLSDIETRIGDQNPVLYLGVGAFSLAKAGFLGGIGRPVGRELRDAGLFIGAGLLLRTYQRRRKGRTEVSAEAESEEEAESAEDAETDGPADPEGECEPTADEPVAVTDTNEDEETEPESDRRRPSVGGVVATAVKRLSGP